MMYLIHQDREGVKMKKKKICWAVFIIGAILVFGIMGGIEFNGEPMSNAWWFIPIILVMLVSAIVGDFFDASEGE